MEINDCQEKIEFEENKFYLLWQKFWDFSNFYSQYRSQVYLKKRNLVNHD
ncbi:hypothetical protein NIES4102_07990 [Chondrocystis sp. NIES-4102]|nr:hypothetical protein NIES4102_07990 [Chondrocystis sp. NIES-4102]